MSRIKQKLSAPKSKGSRPTITDLEDSLRDFEERMREHHALTVRWLLFDSKKAVVDADPLFVDKKSPFATMKPVQILPGEALPSGVTTLMLSSYVGL